MWLLNARTYQLESFEESRTPRYAILSHRWEDEEVTFKEVMKGRQFQKKGWTKIVKCCEEALLEHLSYIWADTCCIDKRSSAELSEAINSMFWYYQNASFCVVYLSDITDITDGTDLTKSVWFTRGWTLQELLAPRRILFFDSTWFFLGEEDDFIKDINSSTGIPEEQLSRFEVLSRRENAPSVAQIMSWAAGRETSRIEDRAYSLMGLFGVNMPLLYGEGEKAFERLQGELMKTSDDLSLFAWRCDRRRMDLGILASSPDDFTHCADVKGIMARYTVTKHFLSFTSSLWHHQGHIFVAPIAHYEGDQGKVLGIYLERCLDEKNASEFHRCAIEQSAVIDFEPRHTWDVQHVPLVDLRIRRASNEMKIYYSDPGLPDFSTFPFSSIPTLGTSTSVEIAIISFTPRNPDFSTPSSFDPVEMMRISHIAHINYRSHPLGTVCLIVNSQWIIYFGRDLLHFEPTVLLKSLDVRDLQIHNVSGNPEPDKQWLINGRKIEICERMATSRCEVKMSQEVRRFYVDATMVQEVEGFARFRFVLAPQTRFIGDKDDSFDVHVEFAPSYVKAHFFPRAWREGMNLPITYTDEDSINRLTGIIAEHSPSTDLDQ